MLSKIKEMAKTTKEVIISRQLNALFKKSIEASEQSALEASESLRPFYRQQAKELTNLRKDVKKIMLMNLKSKMFKNNE